jgi:hypothetical protein
MRASTAIGAAAAGCVVSRITAALRMARWRFVVGKLKRPEQHSDAFYVTRGLLETIVTGQVPSSAELPASKPPYEVRLVLGRETLRVFPAADRVSAEALQKDLTAELSRSVADFCDVHGVPTHYQRELAAPS